MAKPRAPAPLPSKEQILAFVAEQDHRVSKRDIARAFRIKGDQRVLLKAMLKELDASGLLARRGREVAAPGRLPPVAVVEIAAVDLDGELYAHPLKWEGDGPPPRILMVPEATGQAAPGPGERMLVRLHRLDSGLYEGRVIRRIDVRPKAVLGIFQRVGGDGRIVPTDRRARGEFTVARTDAGAARSGELVLGEIMGGSALGPQRARITRCLGHLDEPGTVSLIAIHTHGIPVDFSQSALAEAAACRPAPLSGREDLRAVPLVTIDGADARDFDDAVFAEPDPDPANPGGHHAIVAIADVAYFVRPGGALDRAAYGRGNSVYFPDRAVHMLPEALAADLCSLKPDQERACLAVHLWLDADGRKRRHRFARALMRSAARLTYAAVEAARTGDSPLGHHLATYVLAPLWSAYAALKRAREGRQPLDLDLPEKEVVIGTDGRIERIAPRPRLESHKLIEEFMIAANVAAAEELERLRQPCLYRVHDQPALAKTEALRVFLEGLGYRLPKGPALKPAFFNRVLVDAATTANAELVNMVILRSQAQAQYTPANIGHFGLNLRRYCHFTSPIRRYADLLVHRALVAGLGLGAGALPEEAGADFVAAGEHLSATEQRAVAAERDATDRYLALFMAERAGASFRGRVSGVTRFGLFVTLDETGASGLVPVRTLGREYFQHDEAGHALVGQETGRAFRLGDRVSVRLVAADTVTGGLRFEMESVEETGAIIKPSQPRPGRRPIRRRR
ncbi:MAG: ribonuclease R [Alphaproteobacteria bacterium]|nr:ribonuclease R [Alphaproteobacteria bacterium]